MKYSDEKPLVGQDKIWAANTLKDVVDDLIVDPRFVGLSKYVVNIEFFWSREIPTACAGHGFIFFNPDFFDSIPEETRKTVIVHEIWHLILRHLERGEGHDPYQHNIAADHVINLGLEADGYTFEGTDPYKDPIYKGKSTEEVYMAIYEKKPEDRPQPDPNHVSKEQIEDMISDVLAQQGGGKSLETQKEKAKKDVEDHEKGIGASSGNTGIQLDISNKLRPVIGATYMEIFDKYLIDPLSGGKRTFMRPNRRQHAMKGSTLRLPGKFPRRGHMNRLTHLVYALDVSGSISQTQATQFHQSVGTIKKLLNPEKLTVLFFDTRIVLERVFTDKQDYSQIKVNAGGGTDLRGVYQRVEELAPEAMVCFTDLCVQIPPQKNWDSIWLIPEKNCHIPDDLYGKVYLIPDFKV